MALERDLPASGDMCVSVLSRLCTVMPSMYRVGVSKVSGTRSAPGGPTFRGFKREPVESECPSERSLAQKQCS